MFGVNPGGPGIAPRMTCQLSPSQMCQNPEMYQARPASASSSVSGRSTGLVMVDCHSGRQNGAGSPRGPCGPISASNVNAASSGINVSVPAIIWGSPGLRGMA